MTQTAYFKERILDWLTSVPCNDRSAKSPCFVKKTHIESCREPMKHDKYRMLDNIWARMKVNSKHRYAILCFLLIVFLRYFQMAKYKTPKYVQFVTEFPLTVTGKVQKYKIREMATKSLGLEHVMWFQETIKAIHIRWRRLLTWSFNASLGPYALVPGFSVVFINVLFVCSKSSMFSLTKTSYLYKMKLTSGECGIKLAK